MGSVRQHILFALAALFGAVLSAGPDKPTAVVVVGTLRNDDACRKEMVEAVDDALRQLNARGGTARLAHAVQIRLALEEAKVPKPKAKAAVQALAEVAAATGPRTRELAHTIAFANDLVSQRMLGFCVLPRDCSAGRTEASHLVYTYRGGPAVLIAPTPGMEGPLKFALNYYNTIAHAAGENFVARWLRAGHRLESLREGSADRHYRDWASADYDGSFPPPSDAVDQAFAQIVMKLYLSRVKVTGFALFFPAEDAVNREHARAADFAYLSEGRNAGLTRPRLQDLGITAENYLVRADEILDEMNQAMAQDAGLN